MGFDRKQVEAGRRWVSRRDRVLRPIMRRVGPWTLRAQRDRFRMLAKSIVYQQISTKAADSIWSRLESKLPAKRICSRGLMELSNDELRSAGISPQKSRYLRDLARCVSDGTVCLRSIGRKPDDAVVEELTQVKGVGPWTAQMFLIFSLGRLNVLPVGDLGLRAAVQRLHDLAELPPADECERLADAWRPYATIGTWYCWRSLELES